MGPKSKRAKRKIKRRLREADAIIAKLSKPVIPMHSTYVLTDEDYIEFDTKGIHQSYYGTKGHYG